MELMFVLISYSGDTIEVCYEYTTGYREHLKTFLRVGERAEAEQFAFRTAVQEKTGVQRLWDGEEMRLLHPSDVERTWYYVLAPIEERKTVTVPKQWRYWCRKYGLRPRTYHREGWAWMSLIGKGHHWRINMYAEFQCGEPYEEFDRWALSLTTSAGIPQNEAEFKATVLRLIDEHRAASIERDEASAKEQQHG